MRQPEPQPLCSGTSEDSLSPEARGIAQPASEPTASVGATPPPEPTPPPREAPDTSPSSEAPPSSEASAPSDDPPLAPPPPPNDIAHRPGVHPDMDQPRPLRVPTSPQREYILGEAEALRRYIEDGGPLDYVRINRPGARKRLAFVVDRDRFNRIRAQLRTEQHGNHPWIWTPKTGLHRTATPPT